MGATAHCNVGGDLSCQTLATSPPNIEYGLQIHTYMYIIRGNRILGGLYALRGRFCSLSVSQRHQEVRARIAAPCISMQD
eukprot:952756-Amorphochlora_amoeboformis.AAC.2